MLYKNFITIIVFLLLSNCSTDNLSSNKPKKLYANTFTNKGFTIIYSNKLYLNKKISNKIDGRSLIIFQKNLKENTQVKITNIINNKSLIAKVGKKTYYPSFNNSVISLRIAEELSIDKNEPYIEISAISENALFIAKKAKTFDEEKNVANKVPVNIISIDNLNSKKKRKKKNDIRKFSYFIKIADFYYKDTALIMVKRIKTETNLKSPNIEKISDKKYRVYLGPFDNINSLQKSYNDIDILEFDNIEIIKND